MTINEGYWTAALLKQRVDKAREAGLPISKIIHAAALLGVHMAIVPEDGDPRGKVLSLRVIERHGTPTTTPTSRYAGRAKLIVKK